VSMAKPVVKWAAEPPNAAQIPFYLGRAYQEANTGRKGAVHLTIPVDLFLARTDTPAALPKPVDDTAPAPASAEIARAVKLLRAAERPAIIAGSGVWWADAADELRQFVERTSIPLYTITMAKGVVSDEHPLCMGYADPALNQAVHTAFKEADLFLVLGK